MRLKITIEGTAPLLCNQFTDEAAMNASNGTRTSSAGGDRGTPQEICQKLLYTGLDGKPMIPQPNLMRCLVDGGRFHKIGKSQVTTTKSTMLYACVDIDGAEIPLQHKQPWRVDTRAVRIPTTGGRILKHRPVFDDWQLKFEVSLDEQMIGAGLFRMIVDDAGKRIGLGDFRPACKGPFGKFVVTHWSAVKGE
jgi:hypothetical protein